MAQNETQAEPEAWGDSMNCGQYDTGTQGEGWHRWSVWIKTAVVYNLNVVLVAATGMLEI